MDTPGRCSESPKRGPGMSVVIKNGTGKYLGKPRGKG